MLKEALFNQLQRDLQQKNIFFKEPTSSPPFLAQKLLKNSKDSLRSLYSGYFINFAGETGIEPATYGFGDRRFILKGKRISPRSTGLARYFSPFSLKTRSARCIAATS